MRNDVKAASLALKPNASRVCRFSVSVVGLYELRLPLSALHAQGDVNSATRLRARKELNTNGRRSLFLYVFVISNKFFAAS